VSESRDSPCKPEGKGIRGQRGMEWFVLPAPKDKSAWRQRSYGSAAEGKQPAASRGEVPGPFCDAGSLCVCVCLPQPSATLWIQALHGDRACLAGP
jgi:hypothetical protein